MRRSIALIAGALASLSLAACGGDDDDSGSSEPAAAKKPTAISLTATEQGDRMSLKLSGEPKPGPATISFTNEGKAEHEAQMLRIEGDHSQKEMLAALEGTGNGRADPRVAARRRRSRPDQARLLDLGGRDPRARHLLRARHRVDRG